jgi:streptomycin 6-kinase
LKTLQNFHIPDWLVASCANEENRLRWLSGLPETVADLLVRWELELDSPFGRHSGCSWVAPVKLRGRTDAVLKVGMPHMEAEQEIEGLRFWAGDAAVQLLESDHTYNAMVLERCMPGTSLKYATEEKQDVVLANLLNRIWRIPTCPHPFRPLAEMTDSWSRETRLKRDQWPDSGLVEQGLALFKELARYQAKQVLLATDLHAGNVLKSQREPWLVIVS